MNINNINAGVATMDTSPIEAPVHQAIPPDVDPVVKAEKAKILRAKEELKTYNEKPEKEPLSAEETKQITVDLNEYMNDLQTNLRFSIYEKLDHQVVVEIKNKQTDEVIKQIPSEELLELRVKMEELTGLLFDETI